MATIPDPKELRARREARRERTRVWLDDVVTHFTAMELPEEPLEGHQMVRMAEAADRLAVHLHVFPLKPGEMPDPDGPDRKALRLRLEDLRARLRAWSDRVLDHVEGLKMPTTPLEGFRLVRLAEAAGRLADTLYTPVEDLPRLRASEPRRRGRPLTADEEETEDEAEEDFGVHDMPVPDDPAFDGFVWCRSRWDWIKDRYCPPGPAQFMPEVVKVREEARDYRRHMFSFQLFFAKERARHLAKEAEAPP